MRGRMNSGKPPGTFTALLDGRGCCWFGISQESREQCVPVFWEDEGEPDFIPKKPKHVILSNEVKCYLGVLQSVSSGGKVLRHRQILCK